MDEKIWKLIEKNPRGLELLVSWGISPISDEDIKLVENLADVEKYLSESDTVTAGKYFNRACVLMQNNKLLREQSKDYLDTLRKEIYRIKQI
ncbi:MAG: hypothetical protein ACLFPQ_05255 [Candidatus Woesearchaeota archaeon]